MSRIPLLDDIFTVNGIFETNATKNAVYVCNLLTLEKNNGPFSLKNTWLLLFQILFEFGAWQMRALSRYSIRQIKIIVINWWITECSTRLSGKGSENQYLNNFTSISLRPCISKMLHTIILKRAWIILTKLLHGTSYPRSFYTINHPKVFIKLNHCGIWYDDSVQWIHCVELSELPKNDNMDNTKIVCT